MNYGPNGKPFKSEKVGEAVIFMKDEKGAKLMAIFIAQLTREGVRFETGEGIDHWKVILTGGF